MLLFLMLGILFFTTENTVQAVQRFQQQYSAVKAQDVKAIHPWMTVHAISYTYHVPEDYLGRSINMSNPDILRHATLYEIAHRKKQPVEKVTHTLQHAIVVYRNGHVHLRPPSLIRHVDKKPKPLSTLFVRGTLESVFS